MNDMANSRLRAALQRLMAWLASIGAGAYGFGAATGLLRPWMDFEQQRTLMLSAGGVGAAITIWATATFVFHFLDDRQPGRKLHAALVILSVVVAIEVAMITTSIAFGESSPWGHIVEGINGPAIGILAGIVPSWWWAPLWAATLLIVLSAFAHLVRVARRRGAPI